MGEEDKTNIGFSLVLFERGITQNYSSTWQYDSFNSQYVTKYY